MELIYEIFGRGRDLNILQMSCRVIVIFIYALVLIRISGRRSFGIRTALDNIIVILLGTILGRAVVGVSPFIPVITACLVIVIVHRVLGWAIVNSKFLSRIIEGEKITLYKDGNFIQKNFDSALVCKEDILQGVRKSALTEDLTKIDKIYIERNGEISAIKK
ncbi:DUF421 domain-containing protein [Ferruginibacter albus]|uniref:DUF421 domain-containing protein n=1 Tax=Ferruginibacter albus TaxID=2875540 RepID=UPI001CC57243|nr:YetF domain-containing protein [Ferruginibacter albus]UAY52872.1 hypothetical protein K9M53_04130 [Ferruginibacter albus]